MPSAEIVVVEDEPALRELFGDLLGSQGYTPTLFAAIGPAEAHLQRHRPDLLLLDVKLPDGDGLGLLERLQAQGAHIPTVVLTAFGTVDRAVQAMRAGASDFLVKPCDNARFLAAVASVLALGRRLEEVERSPAPEPLTPFVAWSTEVRAARRTSALPRREATLLDGFLHDPEVIVERLLSPQRVPGLVVAAGVVTAGCAAAYEATVVVGFHLGSPRPIAIGPLMVLLAEAAAVGPIFAASVLASARVPVARLGAAILAASATGALLLAALAPALEVIIGFDRVWVGPLSMVAAFLLSGLASGRRLHRLLLGTAEQLYQREAGPTARLCPADAERAGLVARLACVLVGFTLALACWTSSSL